MALSKTAAEAFERFWAAYPRRPDNPKAAAREVFARRVLAGENPAAIADAARRYAAHVAGAKLDPKFIPHARTWLSQRRYEDYREAAPASAGAGQPSPEPPHPLEWMRAEIGADAFGSWIAPLSVDRQGEALVVTARTSFALDEVERRFGRLFPQPVHWRVASRTSS